jgi:hypothetical protein
MSRDFTRRQSIASDDFHLHANVLYLHEFKSEFNYFNSKKIIKIKFNFQLNIHRFKVLARFGLMHVAATNICVWIRTLVLESLKEITAHYIARGNEPEKSPIAEDLRQHTLINAGQTMGVELGPAPPDAEWISKPSRSLNLPGISAEDSHGHILDRLVRSTTAEIATVASTLSSSTRRTTVTLPTTTTEAVTTTVRSFLQSGFDSISSGFNNIKDSIIDTTTTTQTPSTERPIFSFGDSSEDETTSAPSNFFSGLLANAGDKFGSISDLRPDPTSNIDHPIESLSDTFNNLMPHAEAFRYDELSTIAPFHLNATSCERVNIMGTIVADSTPYLYPFIIEYSLIGAAVIYVMWKHIGRYPKYQDEDLEHRLEVMLSRRAVALAQANSGRVDCVGASKGLFFGLLMLVGSLICLILFFVLVRHEQFRILAYYLADASHGVLMILAILAILIGFCR